MVAASGKIVMIEAWIVDDVIQAFRVQVARAVRIVAGKAGITLLEITVNNTVRTEVYRTRSQRISGCLRDVYRWKERISAL